MSKQLVAKILEKHYSDMVGASRFIGLMFEEIAVLKNKKYIDDPQALSLMLEFFGPLKKKQQDSDGDELGKKLSGMHPQIKSHQKNLKDAVSAAVKASKLVKNIDLTSVDDVREKVGGLINAVLNVEKTKETIANDTLDMDELEMIHTPEMSKAIESLYGLVAYNLNASKALIDRQIQNLEKSINPAVLQAAARKAGLSPMKMADPKQQAKDDLKQVMTPWMKHVPNMFKAGLDNSSGGGIPGSMKLRETDKDK